ncbi:MAG TPA: LON peptidase substrate-binding domain-containing protein [Steroidobacteraceae bacterium]
MNPSHSIPLFPLNSVLFPGGPLKLRIFEARYVDMISRCMREGTCFGVAMIVEGSEAGGAARTVEIGTAARIVDFEKLPDGLLGITAIGDRSFAIQSVARQPDALNIAEVEWLPAEPVLEVPADCDYLVQLLQHALPQLAPLYDFTAVAYEDAAWVGARLVELLPLPLTEKQRCLEMRDPLERLEYLRIRVKVEVSAGDEPELQ